VSSPRPRVTSAIGVQYRRSGPIVLISRLHG
jgi:hypothetical protein